MRLIGPEGESEGTGLQQFQVIERGDFVGIFLGDDFALLGHPKVIADGSCR